MALDYLEFDYSEDEEGTGTWDAMASVKAERVPALAAEIEAVLRWASQKFAGRQGAVEEGFDWDYDLQLTDVGAAAAQARITFDAPTRSLCVYVPPAAAPHIRHTVTLTLGGTPAFCAAFRQVFVQD